MWRPNDAQSTIKQLKGEVNIIKRLGEDRAHSADLVVGRSSNQGTGTSHTAALTGNRQHTELSRPVR